MIDANGQTSVTYLNQEGKTVATALAGIPPIIGAGPQTRLDSLSYAAQNQNLLTIDLFNKDANGNSQVNKIPPSNDRISFSSQLLVPFASQYDFKYNLRIDTLDDACLRSSICVNCIYDMEIHVTDECGADLVPTVSPFQTVKYTVGNVDTTGNTLTFNTNCSVPDFRDSVMVSLILAPGVYNVSKVLTVNQEAKDYYVGKYTDSVYNSCVETLSDFKGAAMAAIDTSDCENSCASCLAALGSRDDFVAAGSGTSEDWDYLAEKCNEPCRYKSLCAINYEMLLSDVSPGGQYGKFNTQTFDASGELVSVYNTSNVLAASQSPGQTAHWQSPRMRVNGNFVNEYRELNGVRKRVNVAETSPGVFQPPVTNAFLVYTDNVTSIQYTYPENLQNLSDFMSVWDPGFARSLVMFHPEYAYYVSCAEQAIVFTGDPRSSEDLDSLLYATETAADALTAGFLDSTTYATTTAAINKVTPIWLTASGTYDPFFTNSNFQYLTTANAVTGSKTSLTMGGAASYHVNLQNEMDDIINNYVILGGTPYTMMDIAAVITRCGNNFGNTAPSSACLAFGDDFYVSSPPYPTANDSIRNREWRLFRQLYYSAKQTLQYKRMNFYAKYRSGTNTSYFGGCSACIGNGSYSPFAAKMILLNGLGFPNMSSPYFSISQPCCALTQSYYQGLVRRFYDPANNGLNPDDAALQTYYATGQCPLAFQLQSFFNAMAVEGNISAAGPLSLNTVNEFSQDLYTAVSGGVTPSAFIAYSWNSSVSGNVLTVNIEDPGNVVQCVLKLDKTGSSISAFSDIIGITQLVFDPLGTGSGSFKAVAAYVSAGDTLSANIKGSTSCMDIEACDFAEKCPPSRFAIDMANLFSYLQASGSLDDLTAVPLSNNTIINQMLTPAIKNTLGTPNNNLKYIFVAPDQLTVYDSANVSTKLIFTYAVTPPLAAANIKSFNNIHGNQVNGYTMDGLDSLGNVIAAVDGLAFKATSSATIDLNIGSCDIPEPQECRTKEHQVRKDLEDLVSEILTTNPFNANVNLYRLTSFTPLLKSFKPAYIDSTSGVNITSGGTPSYDTLTISFVTDPPGNDDCNLTLYHYQGSPPVLNFSDIIQVNTLYGTGAPDINGNYYDFKALVLYNNGGSPVEDTVYGHSCWPIKNCYECTDYTVRRTFIYSTGYSRTMNQYYNGSNNGNYDTSWTIVQTQPLNGTFPYALTGSPTTYPPNTYAYDVAMPTGFIAIGNTGYINNTASPSYTYPFMTTYKTTFSLPNPLLSNREYYLTIVARAGQQICRISLNGTSLYTGTGGAGHTGSPVSVSEDTQTGSLLVAGSNTIEIDAHAVTTNTVGATTRYTSMAAEVILKEYSRLCPTGTPDSVFIFPLYEKHDNPCVQQKINLALQNAGNRFKQYTDSITTLFADRYTRHCLGALEKFSSKYTDKEYHHTLYYYDQAGNLVRTIPPAGVGYLPITSTADNLEQQIIYDRTNGQQSVFTDHRMASKYVYNSLNQLIFQSVPDHDNMDVCDGINPNGLDTGLVVNAVQFVSPSRGYLCGEIKNGSSDRGYVYMTNDGGSSWTRVNGVTSGNMQKVQFVNSTLGFAVSDFGMLFRTADGGNTWDLLTGLYNPLSGTRYVNLLNDVFFSSTTDGIVGGISIGGNSPIFYTTDGGDNFSPATVAGIAAGDTITGFTYDGTTHVATAKNGRTGKIFTSTTNGTSWTQAQFAANNLKRVQFINSSLAYAVGEDGTLMRLDQTISGTPIFRVVPATMTGQFTDVYFKNDTTGVAIIDSLPGLGKIFKTFDAGITWELLSANGDYYNSLKVYDGTNHKLIAAGRQGLVARVLLASAPFAVVRQKLPVPYRLSFADAIDNSNKVIAMGVSDLNADVYFTYNAQAANPVWVTIDSDAQSLPVASADAKFKKVIILDSAASGPYVKGLLLTTNGKLYSFYRPYNSATMICRAADLTAGTGVEFFTDISANAHAFTAPIYAFDTVSKKIYRFLFSGTKAVATVFLNTTPIAGNINAIDIIDSGVEMIMVGNSGHIEYTSNLASTTTWNNVSLNAIPVAINRVKALSTNNFIAVGQDGSVWKNLSTASTWYLKNSGTAEKLNSVSVDASGDGLIVGNNGKLFKLSGAGSQPILTSISSGVTAHLTDAAIQPSGSSAYATAVNGSVLYMSSYTSPSPQLAASASPYAVNGVTYRSGANAFVVGDKARITRYNGVSAMAMKELFTKSLISIHFFDANHGFAIDANDVIRQTSDGGLTWSVVVPWIGSPQLTKIHTTQPDGAVLIGMDTLVARITGGNISLLTVPGTIPGTTDFYDLDFNAAKTYGYIVGSNTYVARIAGNTITDLGQIPSSPTGKDFRTVHTFNNNTFIAAGTKGTIWYWKNNTFTRQMSYTPPAGLSTNDITMRDIYFPDDYAGYVVGGHGAAFKVVMNDSIGTDGTVTDALQWNTFCHTAIYMAYSSYTDLKNLDFRAIASPVRTSLMIAGADTNITVGGFTPNRYARMMKELQGCYSTRFWYDKLGRLVLSQNTKQINKQAYSYTLYDALGRIMEVGEKYENASPPLQSSIFGSMVNGFFNSNALDEDNFLDWIGASGDRREVTHTYYDAQNILSGPTQDNLRKRVASMTFEDLYDASDATFNHATHYSYDIHGNMKTLWQENPSLTTVGQNLKQVDYQYDLVSGKVNKVIYAPGERDQFIHRYDYDADNRITRVETSVDDIHYDLDAKYFYYAHGPLARVEYGKAQVQGMDYAYTLQGWIKGVNSSIVKKARDMGSDGDLSFSNPNGNFARDIMGYTLNYYAGDYEAIDFTKWNTAATRFEAYMPGSDYESVTNSLYNGNISGMVTSISRIDTLGSLVSTITNAEPLTLAQSYRYDQLNRLTRAHAYNNIDTTNNEWQNTGATTGLYRNAFSYDANGNILTQAKHDSIGGDVDSLIYNYDVQGGRLVRNRLYHVNDEVASPPNIGDINDQGTFTPGTGINGGNNYSYDEIGNMVKDNIEEIDSIRWTVSGKIKAIKRLPGSAHDNLYFDYDAAGNRVAKHVTTWDAIWKWSDYYQRDAQGNVMSVYHAETDPVTSMLSYKLTEQDLYGSSRLGIARNDLEMIGAFTSGDTTKSYLGLKRYELGNHLGNVLSVISDKKIALDNNTDNVIDYYVPDQARATDYYAFGQEMYGRRLTFGGYRYGFNGKENDNEVKGSGNQQDYGMRIYDPRLGRFLSTDPLMKTFPMLTPYQFASNTPISAIDLDGMEEYNVTKTYAYNQSTGKAKLSVTITYNAPYYEGGTNNQRRESSLGAGDPNRKADINVNGYTTVHNNWPTTYGFIPSVETQNVPVVDDNGSYQNLPLKDGKGMRFSDPTMMGARFKNMRANVEFDKTTNLLYGTNLAFGAVAQDALDLYVDVLLSNPELSATITGNTSRKGSTESNNILSLNRANDVMQKVLNIATGKGATSDQVINLQGRINVIGAGESNSTNADGTDVPADRNVEFDINLPAGTQNN
ncbi:MAG: YCF48-related protein [Bacteroidota bacterium]